MPCNTPEDEHVPLLALAVVLVLAAPGSAIALFGSTAAASSASTLGSAAAHGSATTLGSASSASTLGSAGSAERIDIIATFALLTGQRSIAVVCQFCMNHRHNDQAMDTY